MTKSTLMLQLIEEGRLKEGKIKQIEVCKPSVENTMATC
jgi:hypothetical protein